MLRRALDPSALFFLIALPLMLVLFQSRGLNDPGTQWHTRVGERILDHGFMTTDPFTFTFKDKTWIPQQWGGEVLMAFAHRIGGFDAILLGYCSMFAGAFAIVFRRLLNGGMGWPLAGIVTAMAMIACGFHFYCRPHVFTMVFTIIVTMLLCDMQARRISIAKLWWLVPLFIAWTNLHGGMLGGLAILALFLLAWFMDAVAVENAVRKSSTVKSADAYKPSPSPSLGKGGEQDELPFRHGMQSWREFAYVLGIFVACVLTMFVNPIGLELQRTWFRIVGSPAMAEYVLEHTPLTLARGGDVAVVAFAVVYAVIMVGAWGQLKHHVTWWSPWFWFALTIKTIRNGPLFAAMGIVIVPEIWPHTAWHRRLRQSGDLLAQEPGRLGPWPWEAMAIPVCLIALSLCFQAFRVPAPVIGHGWARFDERFVPLDIVDSVRNIPAGSRIYNDANLGGFLIGHAPDLKIFIDDRFELCGDDWLRDYVHTINDHPAGFDAWQRQHGFEWALLIPANTPALAEHLQASGHWRIAHAGRIATLYHYHP